MENSMTLKLPAVGKNEALARSIVAAFAVELDPDTDELGDIKTNSEVFRTKRNIFFNNACYKLIVGILQYKTYLLSLIHI